MPIDIKWIRNHAHQVQTWQQQRGRLNNEDQGLSVVTRTVQLDQDCRQRLHHIRVLRESINKLSKQLRSVAVVTTTTTTTTNEEQQQQQQHRRGILVQQRKDLQISVTREETLYQEQQVTLQKLLWCLASPIDNVITDTYPSWDNCNKNINHYRIHPSSNTEEKAKEGMALLDLSQNTGWRLAQGIMAVSIHHFGSKYDQIHSLSSSKDLFQSSTTTSTNTTTSLSVQELDLFHAMWGCTSITSGPSSCFLCTASAPATQEQEQQQHSSSPPPLDESVPLWIPFMAKAIAKKSIFGAKQLPQYTLLQDIEELDLQIVAITAGTTWDARQVQQQLANELISLYEQFLVVHDHHHDDDNCTSSNRHHRLTERIQLWACPPTQLALHEQSRIVLTLGGGILGWVSNFGDAAARACEWYFQGGGRHDTKDYVHVIHASIVSPQTIQQLLQANIHHDQNRIHIPPIVQQQLQLGGNTSLQEDGLVVPEDSIPLEAVQSSKDILAVPRHATQPRSNNTNNMTSKPRRIVFPQWEPRPIHSLGLGKKWKDAEALACPFGFLI